MQQSSGSWCELMCYFAGAAREGTTFLSAWETNARRMLYQGPLDDDDTARGVSFWAANREV